VWLIKGIGAVAGIASLFIIKKSPSTKEEEEANKLGWRQKIVVILVSGFLFLYVGAEVAFGGWIYTFSLRKGISKSDAYYLNSCFWGTLTLGRLLGVPVVTKVSPSVMIIVDMIGCIASVIIMLIWPDNHVVLWIGTAGLGFFMATTFPSAISLPGSLNIKVSGLDTSFFVMGASLGELVLPVLVGLLFQTFGVQILDYILIIDFVAALVLFILIIGYIKILKPGGAAPVQDIILTGVEVNPEEQKLLNPVDEDHSDQEEAQMEQDYDTDDYFSSDEDNNTV
jgi:fucose permease